jgi:hypothetical protein
LAIRAATQAVAQRLGVDREALMRAFTLTTAPALGFGVIDADKLDRAHWRFSEILFVKLATLDAGRCDYMRQYGRAPETGPAPTSRSSADGSAHVH